jgi:hypothetical protein
MEMGSIEEKRREEVLWRSFAAGETELVKNIYLLCAIQPNTAA